MRQHPQRMRDRHEAALRAARDRWGQQALICAGEMLRNGTTVLSVDSGQVRGRLVRFWRATACWTLRAVGYNPERGGSSMGRLSRLHETDVNVIATYPRRDVAHLDDGMETG